jgi:hypothetical protein
VLLPLSIHRDALFPNQRRGKDVAGRLDANAYLTALGLQFRDLRLESRDGSAEIPLLGRQTVGLGA